MAARTSHTVRGAGTWLSPRPSVNRFELTRRWVALAATVVVLVGYALAFGEAPTPCREAYLEGGFGAQQISFVEFRELYGDTLCTPATGNAASGLAGSSGSIFEPGM